MNGLNFGRRIPQAEQSAQSFQRQEVVSEPVKERKNWFEKPVISKELFTEINLFIPQVIGLVACIMVGLFVIVFSRLQSVSIHESVKGKVSEEVANVVASQLSGFNTLVMAGVLVPIVVYAGFVLVKFLFFMPRKNRNIVQRIFKGRAILTSVENVKPKMLFDKSNKKTEVMITNPGKHYDYLTNRPIIYMQEEARTNVSILPEDLDFSGRGRDTDSMVANAFHTGYEIARDKLMKEEKLIKIVMILMVVVLAVAGLTALMVYRQPEMITQIVNTAVGAAAPPAP